MLTIVATAAAVCPAAEPQLRVGGVFTPEEARRRLADMAAQIPDAEAWRRRAAEIRSGILRGAKLERLPPPCELRPIRHSRRELDGYSVENVAFEALPGFFVTGNLYLPLEFTAPIPGVLAPHGHLKNMRFYEHTQIRCATLARMGAAVLAWDMLGYGESQPCGHDAAEALRIQTYSSLRAVDYLLSLGIVDETRLAVTAVSRFFAAHLGLDLTRVTRPDGTVDESFVTLLDAPALSVFDAAHPRPAHAVQRCDEVRALLDAHGDGSAAN